MQPADLHNDVAQGPADGRAWWLTASDGVKIRVGGWGAGAPKGTILLFPGRTEYIEKYGRSAAGFLARGYATLAIDWRGQGLADRLIADRQAGHVGDFADYQKDVQALIDHAQDLGFAGPYYLVAHSMGGCIGYRALSNGVPFRAAAFTGPMWGIVFPRFVGPFAGTIAAVYRALGMGHKYVPSGRPDNYIQVQPFEGNQLTHDPDMYAYMQAQLAADPRLGLGSPTAQWLHAALSETKWIMSSTAPDVATRTYLGTRESIVDPARVRTRMANWPKGTLIDVPDAAHEILMEVPAIRDRATDEICAFFDAHRPA